MLLQSYNRKELYDMGENLVNVQVIDTNGPITQLHSVETASLFRQSIDPDLPSALTTGSRHTFSLAGNV